jgi:hypothetical protein
VSTPGAPAAGDTRFLLDENVDVALATELRRKQPAIDVPTAVEAGTRGLKDPALLVWAADHGCILITHDKRTMPDHRDWRRKPPDFSRGMNAPLSS